MSDAQDFGAMRVLSAMRDKYHDTTHWPRVWKITRDRYDALDYALRLFWSQGERPQEEVEKAIIWFSNPQVPCKFDYESVCEFTFRNSNYGEALIAALDQARSKIGELRVDLKIAQAGDQSVEQTLRDCYGDKVVELAAAPKRTRRQKAAQKRLAEVLGE